MAQKTSETLEHEARAGDSGPAERSSEILRQTDHRPWPLPRGPWIQRQTWNNLLFAHWPVSPEYLRTFVPPELELDVRDGQCWIGVTPFYIDALRFRAMPSVPGLSAFPELNVRTYVTFGGKPGVYFFSLDATSIMAIMGARTVWGLPYFYSRMLATVAGDGVRYYCERVDIDRGNPSFHGNIKPDPAAIRGHGEFRARYWPTGSVFRAKPGSLEHFLTERYCLYTVDRGRVYRGEIHHVAWPLQRAEAEIERNTMAQADAIVLPDVAPHLLFASKITVLIWAPSRLK